MWVGEEMRNRSGEGTGSFCPSASHDFNAITRVRKENVINVVWHHVEFA